VPTAYLIDTNILLRMARRGQIHVVVDRALAALVEAGSRLYDTHQNIAEFWNVATRPIERNGFGLPADLVNDEVRTFERGMTLLPESERTYQEWRRLVVQHSVSGVKVHDARLAAAMIVHSVTHLLTLNTDDFTRYDGIVAVHPSGVGPTAEDANTGEEEG
jgi:predicted nucleic acid-binding protein